MTATIRFENGETVTLEKDGDIFISRTPFSVPDPFGRVKVTAGGETVTYNGILIEEEMDHTNGYRFTIRQMPKQFIDNIELQNMNEILAGAIEELAAIIGGEE